MTPFAWFGVVLRSLGAWQLLVAMELYVECFNMARGLHRPVLSDLMGYFNLGLIHTIAGLVLLFSHPRWRGPLIRSRARSATRCHRPSTAQNNPKTNGAPERPVYSMPAQSDASALLNVSLGRIAALTSFKFGW